MKRRSFLLHSALLVLLAAAPSQARADFMNWTYSTTATPPVITSGTGSVQLTGVNNGTAASSIALLGIQNSSAATAASPDVYNNAPFSLGVTFTDTTTNNSATLTLSGRLNGDLTATGSSLIANFTGAHSIKLDGHEYVLNLPAMHISAPGTPQQTVVATIHVNDPDHNPGPPPNPGGSGGGVQGAPEPTSLVLGGLGCSLLGLGGWLKRRRLTPPKA
jgi:hypothetical protein